MKTCNACNLRLEDNALRCPRCGGMNFSFTAASQPSQTQLSAQQMPQPPQTQSAQQPVQQPIPQPVQQPAYQPAPQPEQQPIQPVPQPPKKSKKGLIIAIVSVIAGAAVIAGLLIGFGVFSKETTTQNSTSTTASTTETTTAPSTTEPATVPNSASPSAGYFDEDTRTYYNEWANFQIPLATGWTHKTEKGLEEKSDDNLVYGFYATYDAAKYTKIQVAFSDAISSPYAFLQKYVEQKSGTYLTDTKTDTDTLAGATYIVTAFSYDENGTTVYELMCLRDLDGISIIIDFHTENADQIANFIDCVSTIR